jgi:hypothetical protein
MANTAQTATTFNVYLVPFDMKFDIRTKYGRTAMPVPGSAIPHAAKKLLVMVPQDNMRPAIDGRLVGTATNWIEAQALNPCR